MSRDLKKKKSTSKYRKFKVSPLIPIIASLEVIILVVISSYAWFAVSQEKEANTGVITADADSGLDIDFKNANYDDEINIWDYVEDDFKFEPVTSLDGRNVYIPTSGTFSSHDTKTMRFREGTVNDINTKYLNIDFMLTNTTSSVMEVYLNNNSKFKVWNGSTQQNSRALRLAFYQNDGNHGIVDSSILTNTNNENAALDKISNSYTVYFENTRNWSNVYAYVWKNSNNMEAVSWPGSAMTRVAGNIYSYTFSNTDQYDRIIFNDGSRTGTKYSDNSSTCTQTNDLTLYNGRLYQLSGSSAAYQTKTVYFRKPSAWSKVYAHVFVASNNDSSLTTFPGDECTNCGADIYSFTFPKYKTGTTEYAKILFDDGSNSNQTADLNATNNLLYYFSPKNNGTCLSTTYSERTVYFYNSLGWSNPYAKLTAEVTDGSYSSSHTAEVSMMSLSGNVYMVTVPIIYNKIAFEDGPGQTTTTKYTQSGAVASGYIYRPNSTSSTGYTLYSYSYTSYVDGGNYAVISPGVSAGFQRSYTPVIGIADNTGVYTEVVPAFASSIDNYIKGSNNPMFTLQAGEMIDLSMIIWLEGTDADCTDTLYAGKGIELYLEFSTTNTERDIDQVGNYTYRFYDKTREVWTSDRLTNSAGVSVAPVMQLYDATTKRGYLMHAASTTDYNGTRKIDRWECTAPSTLITGTDNGGYSHDLYFRRVDPYNEDEVWNYWHPIQVKSSAGTILEAQSTDSGTTYINFTAFADGAPASTTSDSTGIPGNTTVLTAANSSNANTPAQSCGGLWGTYECALLTVVDNTYNSYTGNHWLNDDGGVLTMKYSYNYTSGRTQAIEYKASGPYKGQFYYFVVPKVLNATTGGVAGGSSRCSSYTFHRFWGFDTKYAMNIYERNSSMSYNSTGTATIGSYLKTYYVWLGQTMGATTINQYWFGDLLFVNLSIKDEGGNNDVMNNARYKLHVWNSSTNDDLFLYTNNGNFQHTNYNGYVAVMPSGFTSMQLQRCKSDFSATWNYSGNITFDSSKRNLCAYKWNGSTIVTSYDASVPSSWPTIPSYTDNN